MKKLDKSDWLLIGTTVFLIAGIILMLKAIR